MNLQTLTPNLMVQNVNDTINYYQDNLGFTVLETVPQEGPLDWAMVKRNDIVIMFQSKRSLSEELPRFQKQNPGGGFTLFIKMEGIHELFYELSETAEIISEIEDTFYGTTEFSITDPNGYVLTFSEKNDKEQE